MPTFRPDLDQIITYDPGKPIEEVSRELGLEDVVKLASNESPVEAFPEVQDAIARAADGVHRYPETSSYYLAEALAEHHGVDRTEVWVGPGSTGILVSMALATIRPGTSSVFADPSFVVYPIGTAIGGGESIRVPLDADYRHDPHAMAGAVRDDTRVVFYCNPNNPTGTHTSGKDVAALVASVPDRVLVVVDEAYAEYAIATDYASAIPLIASHPNVVVTRTFSKVYGLAGMRVGYAIGQRATLDALRRLQLPFATTTLAQVAAIEALRHPERLAERVADNAAGRDMLTAELRARGQHAIDSQTNFVLWQTPGDAAGTAAAFLRKGVIVRPMGPWIRISVGTESENRRFSVVLDDVIESTG
ncbi:MAG: histidinol-phosphate transaminase [Acidimicrobiia bacterium]